METSRIEYVFTSEQSEKLKILEQRALIDEFKAFDVKGDGTIDEK